MKIKKTAALFGMGIALAAGVSRWCRSNSVKRKAPEVSREASGSDWWAAALEEDARVFNGLYTGLDRVSSGAGKPEKLLRQWCQRACHRWENQPVDGLCRERILPLTESSDREALIHWAGILLEAAEKAGITREPSQTLVLTEEQLEDYLEWNGAELEPGDTIRILTPAWHQRGKLLEQGQCEKI